MMPTGFGLWETMTNLVPTNQLAKSAIYSFKIIKIKTLPSYTRVMKNDQKRQEKLS